MSQVHKNYLKRHKTLVADDMGSGPFKAAQPQWRQEKLPLLSGSCPKRYLLDFSQMIALVEHLLAKQYDSYRGQQVDVSKQLDWLSSAAAIAKGRWDVSETAYPKSKTA